MLEHNLRYCETVDEMFDYIRSVYDTCEVLSPKVINTFAWGLAQGVSIAKLKAK